LIDGRGDPVVSRYCLFVLLVVKPKPQNDNSFFIRKTAIGTPDANKLGQAA
jgi:hypothetical protein